MCRPVRFGAKCKLDGRSASPDRGGYSLIEVLVAMMVLGVLISILLPALHRTMRYSAPLMRCSNNLRQLHQAVSIYVGSSHDVLPLAGYEPLRDQTFPRLNETLRDYGVGAIAFWTCAADPRPSAVTERWGSVVYPPGRFMRTTRRRTRIDDFGPEYPLLADRGPFHLLTERGVPPESPMRFSIDPANNQMQSGFYDGHNSVWIGGRVTHRSPRGPEQQP